MVIIDAINMCSQGRIYIVDFFGGIKPDFVSVTVDTEIGGIILKRSKTAEDAFAVDPKGRIFMPAWIRKRLPNGIKGFYVALINHEKVLVPAEEDITWAKAR